LKKQVYWVNDFFCGAGGIGLGFKQAGFRVAGAYDFDRWAVESYGANISPKVKHWDITQMKGKDLNYADVWTFGFPCQDISVAGKQAGMIKGVTRSGLFYEVMRLLEETRAIDPTKMPQILLAENVKAVEKYIPDINKEFNKQGYSLITQLYNSKYWGVPQNRERYFIVGIRKDLAQNFSFPKEQRVHVPKLKSILESNVDPKYYISKEEQFLEATIQQLESKLKKNSEERKDSGRCSHIVRLLNINPSGNGLNGLIYSDEGVSPTLLAINEGIKILVEINNSDYRIRRLTPREHARLQAFPDSYVFQVSDSQLYKQFGNAVTVSVAKAIADTIYCYLLNEDYLLQAA